MSKSNIPTGTYALSTAPFQAPEYSALRLLVDIVQSGAPLRGADVVLYTLSWLAVSRLLVRGELQGFNGISDLLLENCWISAKKAGLPEEAFAIVWTDAKDVRSQESFRGRVLGGVADLVDQFGSAEWNLADSIGELFGSFQLGGYAGGEGYDTGLCDLLVDLLNATPGDSVWIPFDVTGQLVIRALRRDLRVIAGGPGRDMWSSVVVRLIALIDGRASQLSLEIRGINGPETSRLEAVDYLLACPPIGLKIIPGAGWQQWEGSEPGLPGSDSIYKRIAGQSIVQLERSESWAIAAFWPYVTERAVFLTAPNVLFSKGQEQRLREFLVLGAQQPAAVVSLPARLINRTGIVSAITILDRRHQNASVRMVDATDCTTESKSTMRFSRLLDAKRVAELVNGMLTDDGIAKNATFEEIASQECNLMPARYLRVFTGTDGERVALGDLIEIVVRAPVVSKDVTAITAQEIGISDLERWSALSGPFAKTTTLQAKKLAECNLAQGDILVSIKGTVGKVGLFGTVGNDESSTPAVVCSQSCIALRMKRNSIGILPLYLYLRSEDFRSQLDAFRVGVSVAHITPTTLLQDIKVPTNAILDEHTAQARFAELCQLENDVERAYRRMDEIRSGL